MPQGLEYRFGLAAWNALQDAVSALAEITVATMAERLSDSGITIDASELLEAAAVAGLVERVSVQRCPVARCGRVLSPDEIEQGECPYCQTDLRELGEPLVRDQLYRTKQLPSRDIAWVIVVHGMNTRGEWQEELSWRVANKLKYHAPVLVYKYGWIRFSVLVRWRHRALAYGLGLRIRKAIEHVRDNQITQKPDVVLHSFGNQLFRLMLEMPEFRDLSFGRVITTGSIIRPDFRWTDVIEGGRVEAVLNHCGGQDVPVRITQFCIPDTGPGGRHGFDDPQVINVLSPTYAHGTVFKDDVMAENLDEGGLWSRFLTLPPSRLLEISGFKATQWRPAPRWLRYLTNISIIGFLACFAAALAVATGLGLRDLLRYAF